MHSSLSIHRSPNSVKTVCAVDISRPRFERESFNDHLLPSLSILENRSYFHVRVCLEEEYPNNLASE